MLVNLWQFLIKLIYLFLHTHIYYGRVEDMCEIADIHCFGFDFLADKFEEVLFLFLLVVHEE